jgi:hypothetical protein
VSRTTWVRVFWAQKIIPNWTIPAKISMNMGKTRANSTSDWPRPVVRRRRVGEGEGVTGRNVPQRQRRIVLVPTLRKQCR